jgi:hypothetical protein
MHVLGCDRKTHARGLGAFVGEEQNRLGVCVEMRRIRAGARLAGEDTGATTDAEIERPAKVPCLTSA